MVNIFDTLLQSNTSLSNVAGNELDRYLATGTEQVDNALHWWTERRTLYPHLSRMALDYLSIPGAQNMYFSSCNPLTLCYSNFRGCGAHFQPRTIHPSLRSKQALSAVYSSTVMWLATGAYVAMYMTRMFSQVSRLPDVEGDVDVEFEEGVG